MDAASAIRLQDTASVRTTWPFVLALMLGAVFVAGTGFSHVGAIHNAAHDARHAAGFPCH